MDEKQAITQVFNLVSKLYDNHSLRFFPACAEKMVTTAEIKPGNKVLDIATGTGMVAIAAAQVVGNEGSVDAIDLSENMLDQAKENVTRAGLSNIRFHIMDAEQLEFNDNEFDVITCSYGLFFIPDMPAALKSWLRVLSSPVSPLLHLLHRVISFSCILRNMILFRQHLAGYNLLKRPYVKLCWKITVLLMLKSSSHNWAIT